MTSRVSVIQMTSSSNVEDNLLKASSLLQQAAQEGAQLVVLPEMFALMAMDQMQKVKEGELLGKGIIQNFLQQQAQKNNVWLVGGTIPIINPHIENKVFAASIIYNNKGERVAAYHKIHLFDVHVQVSNESFSESQSITPGKESLVIPTPFGKLGLAVCYDVRFPEFFRHMVKAGAEIVALPTAFTYATGQAHWSTLVRARAIENQIYVLAACQTGVHDNGRKTFGHSMIVNPWGEVLSSKPEGEGVLVNDIDLNYLHKLRKEFPVLSHIKF